MQTLRRRTATAGAGLAVAAVLLATAPAAPAAVPTYRVTTDPVQAAAGWLATQFVDGTPLPAPAGDHFTDGTYQGSPVVSYGKNADVIFGLAAAKTAGVKIATALTYLERHVDAYADITNADGFGPSDGAVGKLALAAVVGGADPTNFGGFDLIATLAKDECTTVSPSCAAPGAAANIFSSSSESFVVLAEARTSGYAPSTAALDYLGSLQCTSGGFTTNPTACGRGAADIDATSYAIMALTAAGVHSTEVDDAVAWLKGQQASGGYWVSQKRPNADSTGLAAAALQGAGENVSSARSWLRSQQVRAGSPGAGAIKFAGSVTPTTKSATSPSVLATAQALTGLVDGGSLATVTAAGSTDGVALFAPTASLSTTTVQAGHVQTASGIAFVAGERVRVVIHSTQVTVGSAKADPLGSVKITYTVPSSLGAGAHTVTLTGLTSGLTADRAVTVSAAPTPSPSSSGTTSSSAPPAPVGPQPIAATGRDSRRMLGISVAGALAVIAGAGLLVLGRRRGH